MAATLQSSNAGSPDLKTSFNGSSTRTISLTVPAGSNQLLVLKWASDKFENFTGSPAPPPVATWNSSETLTLAGTTAGTTVNKVQIHYLKAPTQGAHNLTFVTGDQHNLGTLVWEVWQDVDQADTPVWSGTPESSSVTSWTSGATVATGYVATACISGNFGTTTAASGTTDILANQATYSGKNASFGYRDGGQPGWTWTGASQVAGGALVIKSAVQSVLGGNVTADDAVAAGTLASSSSDIGGNVTLDDAVAAGTLGLQPGTITISGICNENNGLQPGVTIPLVTFQRLADGVQVLVLTNQTTDGTTADLPMTNSALAQGSWYVVTAWDIDRTKAGVWFKQAT